MDGDGTKAASGFTARTRSPQQEVVVGSLHVEGTSPTWLNGSLYRNVRALVELPGRLLKHWIAFRTCQGSGLTSHTPRPSRTLRW